jgi:hypothetical protein
VSNQKPRVQLRRRDHGTGPLPPDRDQWGRFKKSGPVGKLGLQQMSYPGGWTEFKLADKGGTGPAAAEGSDADPGGAHQAQTGDLVELLLNISNRINEGNERLRVIERDIEKIQFYIGHLTQGN